MAAESLFEKKYSTKSDAFSFGCLIIEVIGDGIVCCLADIADDVVEGKLSLMMLKMQRPYVEVSGDVMDVWRARYENRELAPKLPSATPQFLCHLCASLFDVNRDRRPSFLEIGVYLSWCFLWW